MSLGWAITQPAARETATTPLRTLLPLLPKHSSAGRLGLSPQQHRTSHPPLLPLLPTTRFEKREIYALEHSCCHSVRQEGSMKHSPNKSKATAASSVPRALGRKVQQSPKLAGGVQRWEKQQRGHILPVPQAKLVMEPFKEPRRKILPAQHDAVPLTGAESSAPAQTHSGAKNRQQQQHHPPPPAPFPPQCVT